MAHLKKAIEINKESYIEMASDGIRPYLSEWYDNVFLETFRAKKEPDSKVNNSKGETITATMRDRIDNNKRNE
ncbi:MAG: hypothetical protein JO297_18465 [Nitrososphaeraceae archaeon]|nr:hypothetical protein [Nitrososphaeraceae archaeon]